MLNAKTKTINLFDPTIINCIVKLLQMPVRKKTKPFLCRLPTLIILGLIVIATVIVKLTFFSVLWQTYNSPRGYTLQYPKGWQIDLTRGNEPYERITAKNDEVILAISVYEDKSAPTKEGFDKFLDEIRQSYLNNPDVSLLSFDPGFHPGEYITGEYVAASLWKKATVTYEQTELGIVTQGGHIYILTANVDRQKSKKYTKIVNEVFLRFKPILK